MMKSFVIKAALLTLYRVVLDFSYMAYVSVHYNRVGFYYVSNSIAVIESYVIMYLVFLLLPKRETTPTSVVSIVLFLMMLCPILSYFGFGGGDRFFTYLCVGGFVTAVGCAVGGGIIPLKILRYKRGVYFLFICIFIVIVMSIIMFMNGFPTLTALNPTNVYKVREQFVHFSLGEYCMSWMIYALVPFLIGYCYLRKKYFWIAVLGGIQVLIFLYNGARITFLFPIMTIVFCYAIPRRRVFTMMCCGLSGLLIASLWTYLRYDSYVFSSIFITRFLFTPALINYHYYDFFSQQSLVCLSNSIFKVFVDYPYFMPIQLLIGSLYIGGGETWCNSGFMGNAFMHFGALGIFIFSAGMGLIMKVMDSIYRKSQSLETMVAYACICTLLVNGGFLTVVFSRGMFFLLLITWLYVYYQRYSKENLQEMAKGGS